MDGPAHFSRLLLTFHHALLGPAVTASTHTSHGTSHMVLSFALHTCHFENHLHVPRAYHRACHLGNA